jgi:hypothetical protein
LQIARITEPSDPVALNTDTIPGMERRRRNLDVTAAIGFVPSLPHDLHKNCFPQSAVQKLKTLSIHFLLCARIPPPMERAGDFLGRLLGSLEQPGAGLAWLSSTWPTIVGKSLAAHTRPVRCGKSCLELSADGKAWQQQVETMQRELCDRINQAWGGFLVREVKFVPHTRVIDPSGNQGVSRPRPGRVCYELDNEHLPFIRRRRA